MSRHGLEDVSGYMSDGVLGAYGFHTSGTPFELGRISGRGAHRAGFDAYGWRYNNHTNSYANSYAKEWFA